MTLIHNTYANFWGQFKDPQNGKPISAYPETMVSVLMKDRNIAPEFPYITHDVIRPGMFQNAFVSASIWDRRTATPGFSGLVNEVLTQISKIITPEGVILLTEDVGALWLQRSSTFQTLMREPSDNAIVRGVTNLIVRSYVY